MAAPAALTNLLFFSPDDSLPTREQAQAVWVLNALWREQSTHECFDEQLITESVVKHYAINLLEPELQAVLRFLITKKALVRCENAAGYTISNEIRFRIEQEQNEYNALLQAARLEFLNSIRPLYEHGADALWAAVVQNVPHIIESLYRPREQSEVHSIPAELAIRAFVGLAKRNPLSACAQLLELWAKRAILIHRLSVDPTFESDAARVFRKNQTALLLDTNVLIGLFGASGDSSFEHLLQGFATIATRLGLIPPIVTQRTIGEYQYALKKFLSDLQRKRIPPRTEHSDLRPSFLKAYLQGRMNVEQFKAYFSDIDTLESRVSEQYGIKLKIDAQIDDRYFMPCMRAQGMSALSKSQQTFCKLFEEVKEHIYKTMPQKSEKGPEVVEHDSLLVGYTLLLNDPLASPADLRLLLITEDRRLKDLDIRLMRESQRSVPYVYTIPEFVTNFGLFVSKVNDLARLYKDALSLMYVATMPTDLLALHVIEELTTRLQGGPDWSVRQLVGLALERASKEFTIEIDSGQQQDVHVHVSEEVGKELASIKDALMKANQEHRTKEAIFKDKIAEACRLKKEHELKEHKISTLNMRASWFHWLNGVVKLIAAAISAILIRQGAIGGLSEKLLSWGVVLFVLVITWAVLNVVSVRTKFALRDLRKRADELESSIKKYWLKLLT